MPFRSEKQRKFMWARHPEIARRWTNKYGSKPQSAFEKIAEVRQKSAGKKKVSSSRPR